MMADPCVDELEDPLRVDEFLMGHCHILAAVAFSFLANILLCVASVASNNLIDVASRPDFVVVDSVNFVAADFVDFAVVSFVVEDFVVCFADFVNFVVVVADFEAIEVVQYFFLECDSSSLDSDYWDFVRWAAEAKLDDRDCAADIEDDLQD
jgi:hypothetical protein